MKQHTFVTLTAVLAMTTACSQEVSSSKSQSGTAPITASLDQNETEKTWKTITGIIGDYLGNGDAKIEKVNLSEFDESELKEEISQQIADSAKCNFTTKSTEMTELSYFIGRIPTLFTQGGGEAEALPELKTQLSRLKVVKAFSRELDSVSQRLGVESCPIYKIILLTEEGYLLTAQYELTD